MTPADGPTLRHEGHEPGRHGLGPHVVGERVVVRRLLHGETGPSGGPAMTDVLGTCESWADGRTAVRREDGTVVEIEIADIVSGKPVPPRPSIRLRVSARDAERHAAPLWPGVLREALGEWELRTDPTPVGRLLKRANSCLAMGDPGMPFDEAVEKTVRFYASRGRSALVQVEADSDTEQEFLALGWQEVAGGESDFLLGALSRARRLLAVRDTDVTVSTTVDGPRAEVTATLGARTVGVVQAAVDGDWLGVHGLLVEPDHRRQGIASLMMGEVVALGAERGATTLWLQVETDNTPALAFYEQLGLVAHHRCRYLAAADGQHEL